MMKSRAAPILAIIILCLLAGRIQLCRAETRALDQLLEIFESKGLITSSEAGSIRESMAKEQERLQEKETELEQKEKALIEREQELRERENALGTQAFEPSEGAKPADAEVGAIGVTCDRQERGEVEGKAPRESVSVLNIPLEVAFDNGFCIRDGDADRFSLCLGTLLQADYRYYEYESEDPEKNGFDIRRARLILSGRILERFGYKFQYQFEGAGGRRLLDAYVDTEVWPFLSFRVGQFKEPFGLEMNTSDKNLFFAERSMGFFLTPYRDVGLMAFSSVWNERLFYGVGLFNGDGLDDTPGGDVDAPEFTGRIVLSPFSNQGLPFMDNLQVGGSLSYANIDRNNVDIELRTTGLTTFFDVASRAKFRIIREADYRARYGAELGMALGPVALMAEYIHNLYRDVQTGVERFDIELTDYYVAFLWMVTGEKPAFKEGGFQPIRPLKSLWQGGWGALGLAFRYDAFEADEDVYENLFEAGNSVRQARAYTLSLNWYLNPFARLTVDFTRTDFDSHLLIARDPLTGTAIYSDREDVLTGRFQFAF